MEADPQNSSHYAANAAVMVEDFEKLTQEIRNVLKSPSDVKFMVLHDAYMHFEYRFGVVSLGALSIQPDITPGARHLREVRQLISSSGAICLFSEPQFDPNVWSRIADKADVRFGILDPIGQNLKPGPDLYFLLIRQMAHSLRSCLWP